MAVPYRASSWPLRDERSLKEMTMPEKLKQNDQFPSLTLKLVGDSALTIPDDLSTRYTAVLFFRGPW